MPAKVLQRGCPPGRHHGSTLPSAICRPLWNRQSTTGSGCRWFWRRSSIPARQAGYAIGCWLSLPWASVRSWPEPGLRRDRRSLTRSLCLRSAPGRSWRDLPRVRARDRAFADVSLRERIERDCTGARARSSDTAWLREAARPTSSQAPDLVLTSPAARSKRSEPSSGRTRPL